MTIRLSSRGYNLLVVFIICFLGILIYSNTLDSAFQFDDVNLILNNLSIRNIRDLKAIWNMSTSRFITFLSFALNYRLNGLNVFGYHSFNLFVHVGSAILVWWLTRIILTLPVMKRDQISSQAKWVSFSAGLIFLAHPIQIEAVTYIYQRLTSLATLFYLASLGLYLKSASLQESHPESRAVKNCYVASFIIAIIAMLSKEISVTLPLTILLCEFCFLRKKGGIQWKRTAIFMLIAIIIPIINMVLSKTANIMAVHNIIEKGAKISSWQYLLTQFRVTVTYIRLLFFPLNQNIDYDYPIFRNPLELPLWLSILFLSSVIIAAIKLFPRYRFLSFSVLWFFLTLIPESSIIPIKDVIFEHRLYLPMAGYSFFVAGGLYYLFPCKRTKFAVALLVILAVTYSAMTYQRNKVWKNGVTLWSDAIIKSPKKARTYHNLGLAYYYNGNPSQAVINYAKAIEINPAYAQAYANRGLAYFALGDFRQAILDHTKAIEIEPELSEAYNNRGLAYFALGDFKKAISDYTRAIEINPRYVQAYNNRGNAHINQAAPDEAILDYTRAIEINPRYAQAYYNRANTYMNSGKFNQAILDYNRAVEIEPHMPEVYNNRGLAYYHSGNTDQAIRDWSKAIELAPSFAQACANRGLAYYYKKDFDRAWQDMHKAQTLGYPVNPQILEELKNPVSEKK